MNATASRPVVYLTPMQHRVFQLMCHGLDDRTIALRAGLPGRTVKSQVQGLKERFAAYLPAGAGRRWLAVIVAMKLRGELSIEITPGGTPVL